MLNETIIHWVSHYGYGMIFSLLVFGIVGVPIPDETLLTFVGYLISRGDLHAIPGFIAAFLGSICGITLSFIIGRTGGVHLLRKYGPLLHLTEDRIKRNEHWYVRKGQWSLLLGYFIPGVRHLVAFVAGMHRLRYSAFAFFAYTGGLIWSITFISLGYYAGDKWDLVRERIHSKIFLVLGLFIILMALYYFLSRKIIKKRQGTR
jgi:membrane protein DedA with SNARE-associated domain